MPGFMPGIPIAGPRPSHLGRDGRDKPGHDAGVLRRAEARDLTPFMAKESGAKGGKADKWAARSVRLSAALRENLKRRKEQARARVSEKVRGEAGDGEPAQEPSSQESGNEAASDSPRSGSKT
jgi:hypothetical protein